MPYDPDTAAPATPPHTGDGSSGHEPPKHGWARAAAWAAAILAGLIVVLALILSVLDWNILRGPISRWASGMTGREIHITGDLRVHPLSLTPSATVEGLHVGNPKWAGEGDFAAINKAAASVRLLPLLIGRFDIVSLDIDQASVDLKRGADGRATWQFGDGKSDNAAKLPAIRRFTLNGGKVKYADPTHKIVFQGEFNAREGEAEGGAAPRFALSGEGTLNARPFDLALRGDSLLNVRSGKPYDFKVDLHAGQTRVRAEGAIARPFDFGVISAKLTLSGPDLADLYYVTGLALPNTPPYRLQAAMKRSDGHYELNKIDGRVGSSDLHGALRVDVTKDKPVIEADLRSKSLDFGDFAAITGAPPRLSAAAPTDGAQSAEQTETAQRLAADDRLLPDAKLQVTRLRVMDGSLKYRADSVKAPNLPLRGVALTAKLKDAVLMIDPVSFTLPQGRIDGTIRIDARKDVPQSAIDLRLSNANMQDFMAAKNDQPADQAPLSGKIFARAKLSAPGASVREAAAAADGTVSVVIPKGEIREAFAELMGINVAKGLGLLLTEDESRTPIRCALASFDAKDGILRAQTLVVDTGVVRADGKGDINLQTEKINLSLQGKPKEVRIVRLKTPVLVEGSLRSPKFGIDAKDAAAQAGIAATLGALLTPLAAIIPFVNAGLADNADCNALVAEAKKDGSPVKGPVTQSPEKAPDKAAGKTPVAAKKS